MNATVGSEDERRRELGDFLRKRRSELMRADFGLPPVGRSRVVGLRREEIAAQAGVSVTWYTWLEQGREIHPSRQVLDSLAHNMRMSRAEHDYIVTLAGYSPRPPQPAEPVAAAPAHLQRLMALQGLSPSFAVSPAWDIIGWNHAYQALYPNVATVDAADRNLLWLIFTDPYVRHMLPDWEDMSKSFLGEYRAEAGPLLGHPTHTALVARLQNASPEFSRGWQSHHIQRFASKKRSFHHPAVGELEFEHNRLIPSDAPEANIVIYVPADENSRSKMERLLKAN